MRSRRPKRLEMSVVMPCLNEAVTVGACVREARKALAGAGVRGEVVVADNGSTDGSRRIAASAGARLVRVTGRGYGAALRGGIAASRGKWILMADADHSYDLSSLPAFVNGLRRGCDLVQGSRLRGRILKGAMPWMHRWIGTPILTLLLRVLFGVRVSDSQCGMRAFTRKAYVAMAMRSSGMEFASEMLLKASRLKLRMCEVPIVYRPDGRRRPPHLRTFVDGWRHLRLMLLSSPAWLFLGPGVTMFAVGAACVGAPLFRLEVFGYPVGFHFAILGSALVLIGYQITHLGLCASLLHLGGPRPGWSRSLLKAFSLERILVAGALLAVVGFALDLRVLNYWLREEFSSFSTTMTSIGILGTTLILLGVEAILGGFFLAALISGEMDNGDNS